MIPFDVIPDRLPTVLVDADGYVPGFGRPFIGLAYRDTWVGVWDDGSELVFFDLGGRVRLAVGSDRADYPVGGVPATMAAKDPAGDWIRVKGRFTGPTRFTSPGHFWPDGRDVGYFRVRRNEWMEAVSGGSPDGPGSHAIGAAGGGGEANTGDVLAAVARRYWVGYRDGMVGAGRLALSERGVLGLVGELAGLAVGGVVEFVEDVFDLWEVGHGLEVIDAGLAGLPPGVGVDRAKLVRFVNDALLAASVVPTGAVPMGGFVRGDAGGVGLAGLSPAGLVGLLDRVGASFAAGRDPFADEVVAGIGYDPSERIEARLDRLGLFSLAREVVAGLVAEGGVWQRLRGAGGNVLVAALAASRPALAVGTPSAVTAAVVARVPTLAGLLAVGRVLAGRVQARLEGGAAGATGGGGGVDAWVGQLDRARAVFDRVEAGLAGLLDRSGEAGQAGPGLAAMQQRLTELTLEWVQAMDDYVAPVVDAVGAAAGGGVSGSGWAVVAGTVVPAVGRRGRWSWVSRPRAVPGWGYGTAVGELLGVPLLAEPTDVRPLLGDEIGRGWLWQTMWQEGGVLVSAAGTGLRYVRVSDEGERRVFIVGFWDGGSRRVEVAGIGEYLRGQGITHAHLPARAWRVRRPAAGVTLRSIVWRHRRGDFDVELTAADTAALIDALLGAGSPESDRAVVWLLRLADDSTLEQLYNEHRELMGRVDRRIGADHPSRGRLVAVYQRRIVGGEAGLGRAVVRVTGQPRRAFDPAGITTLLSRSDRRGRLGRIVDEISEDSIVDQVSALAERPRAVMRRLLTAHQIRGVRPAGPSGTGPASAPGAREDLLPVVGDRLDRVLDALDADAAAEHRDLDTLGEVTLTPPVAQQPQLRAALNPTRTPPAGTRTAPAGPLPPFDPDGFADELRQALQADIDRNYARLVAPYRGRKRFAMDRMVDLFNLGADMIEDVFPFVRAPRPVPEGTPVDQNTYHLLDTVDYWGKLHAFESVVDEQERRHLRRDVARIVLKERYPNRRGETARVYRAQHASPKAQVLSDVIDEQVNDDDRVNRILEIHQYWPGGAIRSERKILIRTFAGLDKDDLTTKRCSGTYYIWLTMNLST